MGCGQQRSDDPASDVPSMVVSNLPFEAPPELETIRAALSYRPKYELWTNGSHKERGVFLPSGAKVDNTSAPWQYPIGATFYKTFFYDNAPGDRGRPVETRVIRRDPDGWVYEMFTWDATGQTLVKRDITTSGVVDVSIDGQPAQHTLPSRLDCRKCHEAGASPVLGFRTMQLQEPLAPGGANQTVTLFNSGVLAEPVGADEGFIRLPPEFEAPALAPVADDTKAVLGYIEGNCVHCHNGSDRASAAVDFRAHAALANLVNVNVQTQAAKGVRLVPGVPEQSAIYRVLSREEAAAGLQPMPPLGSICATRRRWRCFAGG